MFKEHCFNFSMCLQVELFYWAKAYLVSEVSAEIFHDNADQEKKLLKNVFPQESKQTNKCVL